MNHKQENELRMRKKKSVSSPMIKLSLFLVYHGVSV